MDGVRRVLFVPKSPLSASAESFLQRASIAIETASQLSDHRDPAPDLLVLGAELGSGQGAANALERFPGIAILGVGAARPSEAELSLLEAYLLEPFTQGDLIGAIGDLLGMSLRRALRMGVEIDAHVARGDESAPKINATLLQLSETGCLLEAESPVRVGETIEVSFVLPSNRESISLDATVVSTNELQLLYGLKWSSGYEAERLAILVFVELGLASGASSAPRGDSAGPRAVATSTAPPIAESGGNGR